jgi:magnesium transporter
MPLSLIAGIGGMSEFTMMTGSKYWGITYPVLFIALIGIAFGNYYLLKWLDKKDKDKNKKDDDM